MAHKILWIDDVPDQVKEPAEQLRDAGYEVVLVDTITEGAELIATSPDRFLAVIVDLLMPGESFWVQSPKGREILETQHGLNVGMVFGRWLLRHWPELKVIGVSIKLDRHDQQVECFKKTGAGYFDKYSLYNSPNDLLLRLSSLAAAATPPGLPLQTVIIHGRDQGAIAELSKFLQTRLHLPAPRIFQQQPEQGQLDHEWPPTAVETRPLIFVLLTRADLGSPPAAGAEGPVTTLLPLIFAAGFWASQCRPNNGRVVVLHQNLAEQLPAKLPGVELIDISPGLDAAFDQLNEAIAPSLR
ncbi:MAG: hypothetical protein OEY01_02405 [Desulfobulbaceae bacterium]|nr:hypothetical protein [Desulfobulbaceae bacterium]HIJ78145.1 hypothetical protein [Deltaproteobacteria bacterium]